MKSSDQLLKTAEAFYKASQAGAKTFPSAPTCAKVKKIVDDMYVKLQQKTYQEQVSGGPSAAIQSSLSILDTYTSPQVVSNNQDLKNKFNECNNALQNLRPKSNLFDNKEEVQALFGLMSHDYRSALLQTKETKPSLHPDIKLPWGAKSLGPISTEVGVSSQDVVDPWNGAGYSNPDKSYNTPDPWGRSPDEAAKPIDTSVSPKQKK